MHLQQLDSLRGRDARRFANRFVRLPFQLYGDCPQWVPPLVSDVKRSLDREKHPFYRHSAAEFYLVERDGQDVGRLAVMQHRAYNEYRGTAEAFFGLFECVDDVQVSRLLFDAAFGWARERGLEAIIGPRHLGSAEPAGILVRGFEHRPAMGMAYNYPYYDALLVDSGFEKVSDSLSGYLSGDHELPERFYRLADKVKERRGWWVKAFSSKDEMRQWIPRVARVFRESFLEFEDFVPPTDDEVAAFAGTLLTIAHPSLIKLVMQGDEVIGFLFAYHDITEALQRAGGRLLPFGWLHLLLGRRRTEWVNINGAGVLPAYQGRGASILLYTEMARTIQSFSFRHADVVAVGEDNIKSRSDMESIGVKWYKAHRSYRRAVGANGAGKPHPYRS